MANVFGSILVGFGIVVMFPGWTSQTFGAYVCFLGLSLIIHSRGE
jgi:hypothetical protein